MRGSAYDTAEAVLDLLNQHPNQFHCMRPVVTMVIEELMSEVDKRDEIEGLGTLFDVPMGAAKALFDAKNVWMERATKAEEKLGATKGRLMKAEKSERELKQRVSDLERWVAGAREFLLTEMPDMLKDAKQANFHAGLIHTVPLDEDWQEGEGRWVFVKNAAS